MASGSPAALQRNLNSLFDSGTMTGLSDRDLIERFSAQREAASEAAFEVLVTRHGPMVLRVCRNVLGNPDDVDDAFQATFLVLVKQRGSIRKLDSVASWLYGVAARVSARARVDAARRRRNETATIRLAAQSVDGAEPEGEVDQALYGPIVQEELRRLPERYRSVVVLCYWEGLTQEQAAAQLGCPIGTVRSRISRARDLLRRRLIRRGLASTAGGLAAVMGSSSTQAAAALASVPSDLIRSSVQAAQRVAAGHATAEVVSLGVATLVKRIVWSMMMAKYKLVGLSLLLTATAATGLIAASQKTGEQAQPAAPQRTRDVLRPFTGNRPNSVNSVPRDYVVEPPDVLLVEVLEALPGRPISGERLVRPDGKISLGFYGEIYVAGLNLNQIKEKVVTHLRRFLNDDSLGLVERNSASGRGEMMTKAADSDRVFVDVAKINSKNYYILGDVQVPGRLPLLGKQTVLDAVNLAGGLKYGAGLASVVLYRANPTGGRSKAMPVNIREVLLGDDASTNYVLEPGDRLVVQRKGQSGSDAPTEVHFTDEPTAASTQPNQNRPRDEAAGEEPTLRDLDHRLSRIEQTLEKLVNKLDHAGR